jgi:hypothetical protein
MDMNNKHKAVLGVGVLILVFVGISIWYLATHPANQAAAPETATTTSPAVTPSGTALTPQHITENAKYYTIDAVYPGSTVLKQAISAQADASAIATMKTFLTQTIDQFKTDGNFANLTVQDIQMQGLDQGRQYSFQAAYQTYQGSHTVSYVYQLNEDTLGAHPNEYYRTFTFDTSTGALLNLGDLFLSTNYLQTLSTAARADLPSIITKASKSTADADYISRGTVANSDNFQNWYIDGQNLVLLFPPYQVGPYSIGTILDPIPLSKLSSILKPAYK